jgi:hypothetical protein
MINHFQFSIDGRIRQRITWFVQRCLFWRNPRILACKHSSIGPDNLASILVATNLLDQAGFQKLTFAHEDGMSDFDDP